MEGPGICETKGHGDRVGEWPQPTDRGDRAQPKVSYTKQCNA